MQPTFSEKLRALLPTKPSARGLNLRPELARMPLPMLREDDPFLPWGKAIIAATRAVACCYVFDLAAYMALGAAGVVALERTIAYAAAARDVLTVLHGPFATADYLAAAGGSAFAVDGITVSSARLQSGYAPQHGDGVFAMKSDLEVETSPVSAYSGCVLRVVPQAASPVNLSIFGRDVLYASPGDDFAEAALAALIKA